MTCLNPKEQLEIHIQLKTSGNRKAIPLRFYLHTHTNTHTPHMCACKSTAWRQLPIDFSCHLGEVNVTFLLWSPVSTLHNWENNYIHIAVTRAKCSINNNHVSLPCCSYYPTVIVIYEELLFLSQCYNPLRVVARRKLRR